MKRLLVIAAVLLLAFAIGQLFYPELFDYFWIDTCLDRGGSWHYDVRECSYTENYTGPRPR